LRPPRKRNIVEAWPLAVPQLRLREPQLFPRPMPHLVLDRAHRAPHSE